MDVIYRLLWCIASIEFLILTLQAMCIMTHEPVGSPIGPSALLLMLGIYGTLKSIVCVHNGVYDGDNRSDGTLFRV